MGIVSMIPAWDVCGKHQKTGSQSPFTQPWLVKWLWP
ncbi:unnamed protein product [Gemmata massiliana]|uniref:Uncharacterized protein n=1 Tax=Gemmata massiliana TaxID=1210884 RepID=A0A6P2CUF8_9BACT|nr:unnamed protein product [Gemmata massiliana]